MDSAVTRILTYMIIEHDKNKQTNKQVSKPANKEQTTKLPSPVPVKTANVAS